MPPSFLKSSAKDYSTFSQSMICGASVFTSCTKDDNPVDPATNLAEKIIGKWITAEFNGQPQPTDNKAVLNFVSDTKAFLSASFIAHPKLSDLWNVQTEYAVVIAGNKVTLTNKIDEHQTIMIELTVSSISTREMQTLMKNTMIIDGQEISSPEMTISFTKVTRDYNEAIIGIWEGQMTSEEDAYSDGKVHRWEYKADGTYVYYSQDEAGEWVPSDNTLNEYFVDGTLLCSRWIDNEQEFREWWEIASIKDGVMKWKALREKEDRSTYTATFEMRKVE